MEQTKMRYFTDIEEYLQALKDKEDQAARKLIAEAVATFKRVKDAAEAKQDADEAEGKDEV